MPTQETIPIRWMKEKNLQGSKTKFFPRTHTKAVKNDDGITLEVLLSKLRRELKTDEQIAAMILNETWEQDVVYYTVEDE